RRRLPRGAVGPRNDRRRRRRPVVARRGGRPRRPRRLGLRRPGDARAAPPRHRRRVRVRRLGSGRRAADGGPDRSGRGRRRHPCRGRHGAVRPARGRAGLGRGPPHRGGRVTRVLATLRLAAWTGGLVVAVRILDTLGRGPLSVPLASPEELAAWAERTPPADMAAALLRLAALGACLHLLTVTVLTVLVRTAGLRWLDALVDRVTPELVRRVATSASGLGLVVGGAAAIPPLPRAGAEPGHLVAAARPAGDGTATMVHLPPA